MKTFKNKQVIIAEKGETQFNDVFESFTDTVYDIPVIVPNNNLQVGKIKDVHYSNGKLIGTLEVFEDNKGNVSFENIKALTPYIDFNKGKTDRNPNRLSNLVNVSFSKVVCTTDAIWAEYVNKYQIDKHNALVDRIQGIINKDFQNLSNADVNDLKDVFKYNSIKNVCLKRDYVKPEDCKSTIRFVGED